MPDPPKPTLRATYTSPSSVKTFTNPITAPLPSLETPTAVKDKVTYLSELRASTKQLQEEINVFLTQKMEEDKAGANATGTEGPEAGSKKGEEESKDELMEENYGEEEIGDEED
ncbi:hypothetical protein EPUS_07215 [Endocarpon pusillum Z07020]|uniref:EKC/KEOPS complex subunit GON7 n=1 Tax=Endocarpon pusillum (strain Z07020 / HMAS-L-300199) TaxID=1263415 RepID=U1GN75_ENDPU|nr:uncharacterized protein EPUS_07215 [Endocarpon pusillum Z07020]ERF73381.1 hypothetical protein EPUS_07215 [Endocarpon pusillum Z07020]